MSKTKTILFVFVALLLVGNAFSQMRRPRPSMAGAPGTATQEEGQRGTPGVTAPFIPFNEKEKIKYEDAVERAKKNDSEGFYWLSYYFFNGDGVEKDLQSGLKFLLNATDLKNARACYLTGQLLEMHRLCDEKGDGIAFNALLPRNEVRDVEERIFRAGIIHTKIPLKMPEAIVPDFHRTGKRYCYTNDVATGYVIGLYSTAVKGGLTYATNDIARLNLTIAKCRERIAYNEKARANGTAALDLLVDTNEKKVTTTQERPIIPWKQRIAEIGKERQALEKSNQERKFWSSWPNRLDTDALNRLVSEVEEKFNCILSPYSTTTWFRTSGKSLVIDNYQIGTFQKVDTEGCIVAYGAYNIRHGGYNNRTDLEELRYFETEKNKQLDLLREKWAKDRGMTLKEAIQKHNDWNASRPTSMGLPRRPEGLIRPGLSSPECEQEKKEREQAAEERKAQLEKLGQIQEELRRQREEK